MTTAVRERRGAQKGDFGPHHRPVDDVETQHGDTTVIPGLLKIRVEKPLGVGATTAVLHVDQNGKGPARTVQDTTLSRRPLHVRG